MKLVQFTDLMGGGVYLNPETVVCVRLPLGVEYDTHKAKTVIQHYNGNTAVQEDIGEVYARLEAA